MSDSSSSFDKLLARKIKLRNRKAKRMEEDKSWYERKRSDSPLKDLGDAHNWYQEDEEKDKPKKKKK